MPQPSGTVTTQSELRIIIADDRSRARQGLRALLSTWPDLQVVGEAADGCEVVEIAAAQRPDVIVMDARMPHIDGLAATRVIKARWPGVRIVVLTMYASHRGEALEAGADAFLIKGCPPDQLLQAIQGHAPQPKG